MANTDDQNNDLTALPSSEGTPAVPPADKPVGEGVDTTKVPEESTPPAFDLSAVPEPEKVNGPLPIMTDAPGVEVDPIKLDADPIPAPAEIKVELPANEPKIDAPKIEEPVEEALEKVEVSGPESMGIKLDTPQVAEKTEQHEKAMAQITPNEEVKEPEETPTEIVAPTPEVTDHNPAMEGAVNAEATAPNDMLLPTEVPGDAPEKKSHLGLYVGAAVFVLLLGGGAYAYMTGLLGFGQSSDQVIETQSEDVSENGDILNAAADEDGEMVEDAMMEDETMSEDDAMTDDITNGGTVDALPDEFSDFLNSEEVVDEASDDLSILDEVIEEESVVDDGAPKRVKRTPSTSTDTDVTMEDAVSEVVEDAVVMGDSIDCGTDMGCFIAAAESCSLASVSQLVLGVDGEYIITGGDTSVCKLKTSAAGYQQECEFPHTDLMAVLNRWLVGEYSTDDYSGALCTVL